MKTNEIIDSNDLCNYLKQKINNETIEFDKDSLASGFIVGKYKGQRFNICYKYDQYLAISTNLKSKMLLDEIKPILAEVMGEPLISYDLLLQERMYEGEAFSIMEWNKEKAETRIKEIVNEEVHTGAKSLNIKIFDGSQPEDYIYPEEAIKKNKTAARIMGIDPGCLIDLGDIEKINSYSEQEVYFLIYELTNTILLEVDKASAKDYKIDPKTIKELKYAFAYSMNLTRKFGVELPEPEVGKQLEPTDSYKAWYTWWDKYFQTTLSEYEFEQYSIAREIGEDVSMYRPEGDWHDYLKKEDKPSQGRVFH